MVTDPAVHPIMHPKVEGKTSIFAENVCNYLLQPKEQPPRRVKLFANKSIWQQLTMGWLTKNFLSWEEELATTLEALLSVRYGLNFNDKSAPKYSKEILVATQTFSSSSSVVSGNFSWRVSFSTLEMNRIP